MNIIDIMIEYIMIIKNLIKTCIRALIFPKFESMASPVGKFLKTEV